MPSINHEAPKDLGWASDAIQELDTRSEAALKWLQSIENRSAASFKHLEERIKELEHPKAEHHE